MREDIMTLHRQRIAIEPTLIRAQRLRDATGVADAFPYSGPKRVSVVRQCMMMDRLGVRKKGG